MRYLNLLLLLIISTTFAFAGKLPRANTQQFIDQMAPLIQQVDQEITQNRQRFFKYYAMYKAGKQLGTPRWEWMAGIANYYKIKNPDFTKAKTWRTLEQRINVIPTSLVLAQAAMESAWGRSRFAKNQNNFFGQHCYKKGCGVIPKRRAKGAKFYVAAFNSPIDSIRGYMHNLNTHYTYKPLRSLRSKLIKEKKPLTGYALAANLDGYSELDGYVKYIRQLIVKYNLKQYDDTIDEATA